MIVGKNGKLYLETSEIYAMEIPDDLYELYKSGKLNIIGVFDELDGEIWNYNQEAHIDKVYIEE